MKKIVLIAFIFFSLLKANAQQMAIGDSAIVSLITCSPGEEVYSKFGHTAIRVKDSKSGIDVVFNYGIFSFQTANFYYKFIKGETDYQLGIYETSLFLPDYADRNSMVWEEILNLTPSEKKNLINLLMVNYQPENRVYRYNFIFDNCATRPRDKIFEALGGYVKFQDKNDKKTFRQWIGVYVGSDTWLKFGIDLVFGLDADLVSSLNESMFLPEVLMNEFQNGQIVTPNGPIRKLVTNEKTVLIHKKTESTVVTPWIFKPMGFSLVLLVLGILLTIWDNYRKKSNLIFDTGILILTGLGGLIVFYLMFFSTHPLVKHNLNILWLNPLNILVAIVLWIKPIRIELFFYQIFNMLLLIGALFAFALSSQVINDACYPLIVLLIMRTTSWFAITKRRIFRHHDIK